MIDIRKLKELVRLMVVNELTELDLRDSEEQVTLRRHSSMPPMPTQPLPAASAASAPASVPAPAAPSGESDQAGRGEVDDLLQIVSPMVGTYYAAPTPDSEEFVKVGSPVTEDTPVCIIEAMKIFNEIKSGCAGTIHRILVSNGDSVEFGQVMFLVKPD